MWVKQAPLLWFGLIALAAVAWIDFPYRGASLVTLMLVLPLLESRWQPPGWALTPKIIGVMLLLLLIAGVVLARHPHHLEFTLATLLYAALPEEWYFRGYLQRSLGNSWRAILVATLAFAALHGITRGWVVGLQVMAPSLLFGWTYQRSGSLLLAILLHSVSNLLYVVYLSRWL